MINIAKHDTYEVFEHLFDKCDGFDMLLEKYKPERILDKLKECSKFETVLNNEIELRMENHGGY